MVATIFSNSASALSKVGDFEALLITCRALKTVKIPHIAVPGQSPHHFLAQSKVVMVSQNNDSIHPGKNSYPPIQIKIAVKTGKAQRTRYDGA
jgi:hypothetical protein